MMKGTILRNIFLFLMYSIYAVTTVSCLPSPEQDEDALRALSLNATLSPPIQSKEKKESPAIQNAFQAKNTDDAILSIPPSRLFVCRKEQGIATVALYFYEPDKNNMICSFLAYSRVYEQETGKYIESNIHTAAPIDKTCVRSFQEKININKAIGWKCPESSLSSKALSFHNF